MMTLTDIVSKLKETCDTDDKEKFLNILTDVCKGIPDSDIVAWFEGICITIDIDKAVKNKLESTISAYKTLERDNKILGNIIEETNEEWLYEREVFDSLKIFEKHLEESFKILSELPSEFRNDYIHSLINIIYDEYQLEDPYIL